MESPNTASRRVWVNHEYTDSEGKVHRCHVQDVTPELNERLINYYLTQFLYDEAISKSIRWAEDKVSRLTRKLGQVLCMTNFHFLRVYCDHALCYITTTVTLIRKFCLF